VARADLDEEALCAGQDVASCAEDSGFGPVLAAFTAEQPAFQADRRSGVHWAQVFDIHLPGHSRKAAHPYRFAHRLIEQRGDDAAMHVAGWALEALRHRERADHASIFGLKETEAQTVVIGRAASKAAALGLVRDWGKVLRRNVHEFRIANQAFSQLSAAIL